MRQQADLCRPDTSGCLCVSMPVACRAGRIEEAVVFAQTSLAPLRGLMTSRMGVSDAMLREVVALLAYEDPMVSTAAWALADEHGVCGFALVCRDVASASVVCCMLHEILGLPVYDTDM